MDAVKPYKKKFKAMKSAARGAVVTVLHVGGGGLRVD